MRKRKGYLTKNKKELNEVNQDEKQEELNHMVYLEAV